MKKKIFSILLLLLLVPLMLTGCGTKKEVNNKSEVTIKVVAIDQDKKEIYNKEIKTSEKYLFDVLKENEEFKLKYEDGQYGAYITSLFGIDQKTDNNGMYYWSYYINDNYAEVGISKCEVEEGSSYKFVYEYYES